MAERASLGPVTMDFERLPAECSADEARNHHSVLTNLSRPDGVEQANDNGVQAPLDEALADRHDELDDLSFDCAG